MYVYFFLRECSTTLPMEWKEVEWYFEWSILFYFCHTVYITVNPRMEEGGRGGRRDHTQYKDHIVHTKHKLEYLVVFGSLGQVKSGVDFSWTLLTEGRQLEGNWLSQAVTCLQLQVGWFSRDLVEVSEEMCQKSAVIEGMIYPFPNLVYVITGEDTISTWKLLSNGVFPLS